MDSIILGVRVQKLVAMATWRPGFVTPASGLRSPRKGPRRHGVFLVRLFRFVSLHLKLGFPFLYEPTLSAFLCALIKDFYKNRTSICLIISPQDPNLYTSAV